MTAQREAARPPGCDDAGTVRYLALCGGGGRGAIEVGFARALWEEGIRFDGIVGSSVGALNGAFLAAGGHPDDLATVWEELRFRDVFRFNWRVLLRGPRESSLFTLGPGLRRSLQVLGSRSFDSLRLPLVVMATDLATGEAVALDEGLVAAAVRASFALPGLLPPILLDKRHLVDGSRSADLPIRDAVRRGATEIWAIRCSCCASPSQRLDSLPGIVAQTFGIAVDRTRWLSERSPPDVKTHVLAVDLGVHVPSLDFSAAPALIAAGYAETSHRLATL